MTWSSNTSGTNTVYLGLLVDLHYSHKITLRRYTGGSFVRLFTQRGVKTNYTY